VHLAKATVDVDPRFGVWESLTGQVLPRGTSSNGVSMTPQNPADSGNGGASSTTAGPAAPATTAPSPLLGALSPQTTNGSSPTTTGG